MPPNSHFGFNHKSKMQRNAFSEIKPAKFKGPRNFYVESFNAIKYLVQLLLNLKSIHFKLTRVLVGVDKYTGMLKLGLKHRTG